MISTRDGDGHGSHTASTAAGNNGVDASVEGRAFGKVSGMAPAAKIAAYKICWNDTDPNTGGCYTSSSLDAIDDAIADGVDVINYSISGATSTVVDAVEYAFLGAAAAGVFVATSAGNSGPAASTVAHNSPWVTTVAASTHVNYENTVVLGTNGLALPGLLHLGDRGPEQPAGQLDRRGCRRSHGRRREPVRARQSRPGDRPPARSWSAPEGSTTGSPRAPRSSRPEASRWCSPTRAPGQSLDADFHSVPTIHVDNVAGAAIKAYAATAGATASFELGDTTGAAPTPVPQVAGFSSRGPAIANAGDVIKPDIAAPGASVLAAVAPPTNSGRDFDLYSGTSMSSPHVAGLAAFMMGVHPAWSPMTVKSAMMTTAYDLFKPDGTKDQNPFNEGAGHVDPTRFFNPGLVVTSTPQEWLSFFEGQGFELGPDVQPMLASDLNIPSMAKGQVTSSVTIARTFTALKAGTWNVQVSVPGFTVVADKADAHVERRPVRRR